MRDIKTTTTATFTTNGGQVVEYQGIFESIRSNVEVYGKTKGAFCGEEDLKDLFQDSALKAVKYHQSFDPGKSSEKTWSSRIAGNCETDWFNSNVKRFSVFEPYVTRDDDGDEYVKHTIASYRGDEFEADRDMRTFEANSRIWAAIASLNENYRYILNLHLQGMKPKKMAEVIGCSAGVAATTLCRARKALATALGAEFLADYGYTA